MASSNFTFEQQRNNVFGFESNYSSGGMAVNTGFSPASTIYTGPPPAMQVNTAPTPVWTSNIGPPSGMAVNTGFAPGSTLYTGLPPAMPLNTGLVPVWTSNTGPLPSMTVNSGFAPASTIYTAPVQFSTVNTGPPPNMTVNTQLAPASTMYTGLPPSMSINTMPTSASTINTRSVPFSSANTGFDFGSSLTTAMNISDLESRSTGTVLHSVHQSNAIADSVELINEHLQGIDLSELINFQYSDLSSRTENFCDLYAEEGGHKIGEGGFGSVYRADISGITVAVKLLKEPVDKQFFTELSILVRYKHENLLRLLGCSVDGPKCCLIYEYMPNGSLEDRLACAGHSPPLPSLTRLQIAYSSALGLNYLHTFSETPMVHRDVKSANILLDENFVPKIGDFGFVRIGGSSSAATMAVTNNWCGTFVYMAREAFCGDVSVKLDTFSFGVVLLELLTGLPPYDEEREDKSLVTHMENCEDILTMLDEEVEWDVEKAIALYEIANQCLIYKKKQRPSIEKILPDLQKVLEFEVSFGFDF